MFHHVVLLVKLSLQSADNFFGASARADNFFELVQYITLYNDSSVFEPSETSSSLQTRKFVREKGVNTTGWTGALLSHQPLTDTLEQTNKPH